MPTDEGADKYQSLATQPRLQPALDGFANTHSVQMEVESSGGFAVQPGGGHILPVVQSSVIDKIRVPAVFADAVYHTAGNNGELGVQQHGAADTVVRAPPGDGSHSSGGLGAGGQGECESEYS